MKTTLTKNIAIAALVILTGLATISPLSANSINGSTPGSSTTRVRVAHHYEYRNGAYVWIPTYYGQALNSKDPFARPYWIAPGYVSHMSGSYQGHWSSETPVLQH